MGRRECGSGSPPSVAISVHNTDGGRKWFLRQKGRIKGCFSLRGKIGGGKAFSERSSKWKRMDVSCQFVAKTRYSHEVNCLIRLSRSLSTSGKAYLQKGMEQMLYFDAGAAS